MYTIAVMDIPNSLVMKEVMRKLGFSKSLIGHVDCLGKQQFPCYVTDDENYFHGQNKAWLFGFIPKVHYTDFLAEYSECCIWSKFDRLVDHSVGELSYEEFGNQTGGEKGRG